MFHDETTPPYSQPHSSTSPDTESSGGHRGDGNGPFDPGNTPPLVFAFIAVGFIIFGLVIAIIYKRPPSAQKPKLWDIWIAPNQRAPDEERTDKFNDWDTFVPLSASLVYPCSPSHPPRVPQQYVQGHVPRPVPLENPEHRLFFRRPPADTSIHVTVMISMPKQPQQPGPVPNRTYAESEFHVGVTDVRWTG